MAPRTCNYTLTDKRIQAAKPKAKPYPLADAGGLYVDVLTSGSKVWHYSYATGASIHETTGYAVAVAFNAGNLEAVALALRAKYSDLKIIVASDDDHLTDGNPGMTKAKAAALAVRGLVAVPVLPEDRPDKATDFNDLHQLGGFEAVKVEIDSAIESVATEAIDVMTTGQNDDWPEPTPLPDALPPVDPFDAELLPVALRPWVMDIAQQSRQHGALSSTMRR